MKYCLAERGLYEQRFQRNARPRTATWFSIFPTKGKLRQAVQLTKRQVSSGPSGDLEVGEEIIPLVIDDDECWEFFHFDAPDCFHAKLWVFLYLDLLDAVQR